MNRGEMKDRILRRLVELLAHDDESFYAAVGEVRILLDGLTRAK